MPERPDHRHLAALAARSRAEAQALTAMLLERCWPGGGDRTVPAAREWVRRWGPRGLAPIPVACTCRAGRCLVCN